MLIFVEWNQLVCNKADGYSKMSVFKKENISWFTNHEVFYYNHATIWPTIPAFGACVRARGLCESDLKGLSHGLHTGDVMGRSSDNLTSMLTFVCASVHVEGSGKLTFEPQAGGEMQSFGK